MSREREGAAEPAPASTRGGRGGEVAYYVGDVPAPLPLPMPPAAIALSGLGETAIGSLHRIARRETIPAEGSWHCATIAAHTLAVELEVLVVPRKARRAYLSGRSMNETGGPASSGRRSPLQRR